MKLTHARGAMVLLIAASCGGSNTTETLDAAVDAPSCSALAVKVAGTPETTPLANAPAKCGAAPYIWRKDADLGAIISRGNKTTYSADQLAALATAGNVALPRAPEFDVATVTLAYKTQDRGAATTSSATVVYPTSLPAGTQAPVLLLLHGTSGFRHACGPTSDPATQLLGAVFASYGWIVAIPDYLGLESMGDDYAALHPYLVGEATAIASLDAARAAVQQVSSEGMCAKPELGVFGGSQGGHAALWVDRLAPYYAREFELLGTVATVPPSDLVAHTDRALRTLVSASANALATFSTQAQWYGQNSKLNQVLKPPYLTSVPAALEASCDPGNAVEPTSLSDVFADGLLTQVASGSIATFPDFGCMVKENSLVDTSVARIVPPSSSYGILFILGQADTLVDPAVERASYDKLCTAGLPLNYLECEGASHTKATAWSIPNILQFLDARKARMPFVKACTRSNAQRCAGTP
jgi:dienelactone hydrolase